MLTWFPFPTASIISVVKLPKLSYGFILFRSGTIISQLESSYTALCYNGVGGDRLGGGIHIFDVEISEWFPDVDYMSTGARVHGCTSQADHEERIPCRQGASPPVRQ